MVKFEYTLPSGAKYVVVAPPDATQEQADVIFYSQVAAGSLVGYETGQTLTNVTVTPLTYELSRQSRGTAGIPGTLSGVYTYRGQIVTEIYNKIIGGYYNRINPNNYDPFNPDGEAEGNVRPPRPGPNPDPFWPIPPKPDPYYPPVPPNPDPKNPVTPGPGPGPGPTPGPVPPFVPPGPVPPIPPLPVVPPLPPPQPPIPGGREFGGREWGDSVPLAGRAGAIVTELFSQTETPSQGYDGFLSPTEIEFAASVINKYPTIQSMADLSKIPIESPVDQADVMLARGERLGAIRVGPLLPFQVQTIQSQIAKIVNQPSDEISQEKGVGKYGLSCYQLEIGGYVKPGTSERYIDLDPVEFEKVMSSPSIWTGKNGVRSLNAYLIAENLQDSTNNYLLGTGYNGLVAAGVIEPQPEREVTYDKSWIYTNTGLQPLGASSIFMRDENGTIGTGTFSLVPTAYYESLTSGVTTEDATSNQDLGLYNFNNVKSGVVKQLYQDYGALVTASGKFGPEVTSLWASSGTVDVFSSVIQNVIDTTNGVNIALNQLGGVGSLYNGAISTTNPLSAASNASRSSYGKYGRYGQGQNYVGLRGTSAMPDSIVQQLLTPMTQLSGAMSVYGKSAQYAMNFADQTGALGDLFSFNSLSDFAADFTGGSDPVDFLISQLNGSGNLLNGFTDVNQLINQFGSFGSIFNSLNLASAFGSLGNLLGGLQIFGNLFGGNNVFTSNIELGIGYSDTVDRATVDAASQKILGDPKIPQPVYGYPGDFWMKIIFDLVRANSKLSDTAKLGDAFVAGSSNIVFRG